jgi:hypothetical protein
MKITGEPKIISPLRALLKLVAFYLFFEIYTSYSTGYMLAFGAAYSLGDNALLFHTYNATRFLIAIFCIAYGVFITRLKK